MGQLLSRHCSMCFDQEYLKGIPEDSRCSKTGVIWKEDQITTGSFG